MHPRREWPVVVGRREGRRLLRGEAAHKGVVHQLLRRGRNAESGRAAAGVGMGSGATALLGFRHGLKSCSSTAKKTGRKIAVLCWICTIFPKKQNIDLHLC